MCPIIPRALGLSEQTLPEHLYTITVKSLSPATKLIKNFEFALDWVQLQESLRTTVAEGRMILFTRETASSHSKSLQKYWNFVHNYNAK